ncbi:tRNA pseudouridine(38-40) synthase TruA [Mucilaginibacter ginsenosidivorans]|uniref:tRNA pseudouridine synthase A n=1 Tax=Mucilaginibacter ginsenosidivorans TaxID=398053 RepID=A0A5B8UVG7_9SPHI|nr:tRNA pseudouridine(38-40) synthase TruA [Mucilaginibacter ginsenosidivorans]QEC62922.1 tRNA pseudouridine(38-40) synthase TruA [Mucilaginibacter ginsenosidivorans]
MSEKQRYFIELTYDGTAYHGWQVQPNAVTVQELLDRSLATVLRQPVETLGCGRTDTGVHATQFFAHLDVEAMDLGPSAVDQKTIHSLNAVLPKDIAIKRILPVHNEAHARFDATQRSYEYHIHFEKDPFRLNRSWELRDKPDIALMNAAAKMMMGYTDFSCFSKSNTQTFTNNCKISRAEWVEHEGGIVFHISADRFLRNMVRAIVGTLMEIGRKEMEPEGIRRIIESKNRGNAGTSVPACGLYLTEVKYPYLLESTI